MRLAVRALIASAAIALLAPAGASATGGGGGGFSFGVAAGEVNSHSAVLWARANRPGFVFFKVAKDPGFNRVVRFGFSYASSFNDLTVQRKVHFLASDTRYWYRFKRFSGDASAIGSFRTAPRPTDNATIRFAWTGDYDATPAVGQTQPFWNNFEIFRRMQAENNHFNIGLGDTIYSDSEVPGRLNPVALTVAAEVGQVQDQPRAGEAVEPARVDRLLLALGRPRVHQRLLAPRERLLDRARSTGEVLYQRGVKAFTDYAPVEYSSKDGIYRTKRWGKNLELFFLDQRSFRSAKASANPACTNPESGEAGHRPHRATGAARLLRAAGAFALGAGLTGLPGGDPRPAADLPRRAPAAEVLP